jgi:hypothetical protein
MAAEDSEFAARSPEQGIDRAGSQHDINGLMSYIVSEANHAHDRRREKRLDARSP